MNKTIELRLESHAIGNAIKETRLKRKMTQKQLGELIGVQKAQISRIENNLSNARMDTIMKVFNALDAEVKFQVEL